MWKNHEILEIHATNRLTDRQFAAELVAKENSNGHLKQYNIKKIMTSFYFYSNGKKKFVTSLFLERKGIGLARPPCAMWFEWVSPQAKSMEKRNVDVLNSSPILLKYICKC